MQNLDNLATHVLSKLQDAFGPINLTHYSPSISTIPIGIEIEIPWRAYFPDLWVDGFPNIPKNQLDTISAECTHREKTLLPKLVKTVECGVKSGADKYWEFAFDPVFDVGIVCSQVELLQKSNLIPPGQHSLHVTIGGIHVTRDVCYLAMLLELYYSSKDRIMKGFHPSDSTLSWGWSRKGYAGTFEKTGDNDIMHGYDIGAEIRTLALPDSIDDLYRLLYTVQYVITASCTGTREWTSIKNELIKCLAHFGLPNQNWKKPHINPEIWTGFANNLDDMRKFMHDFLCTTNLPMTR